jgi:hypothetical protein
MRIDYVSLPMPDWFPDFVREIAALSPAELRELNAMMAEDEARAEAAKRARDSEKQMRQRIALFVAEAKRLKVGVTVESNGGATFHTGGSASAPGDKPQTEQAHGGNAKIDNEVENWISKHHANRR